MKKHEKFILWCDKVMAFSFYALIYFLPISIALSETFTVLALVCFLLKRGFVFYGCLKESTPSGNQLSLGGKITCFLKSFKPVSSPLSWPIVLLLLSSFVSVLFSQYRLTSLSGFLGKTLQSAFLYFNFIECINSKKRLKIFLNIFLVSCTLICINGIYQAVVGDEFIRGRISDGRISSSLRSANDFAAYLIAILPVLFCLAFFMRSKKQSEIREENTSICFTHYGFRIAYIALFMLGFSCLGFTFSRGAWVGFMFSLLIMSVLGLRSRKIIVAYGLLITFFLITIYPGLLVTKVPLQGIRLALVDNISSTASSPSETSFPTEKTSLSKTSSPSVSSKQKDYRKRIRRTIGDRFHMDNYRTFVVNNNRIGYWKRSFNIIKDYPVVGSGLNTYALVEGSYDVGWGGYPHNSYLQMAAETGIVGVGTFLWMLFVLFRESLRALKKIKIQEFKILLFGFLTGLLGFLIHSFFDTNLYSVQLSSLLWIIIGVVVVLQKVETT